MTGSTDPLAAIAHLLPEAVVGTVTAVAPISLGLSGAGVWAVTTSLGELVLRVSSERDDDPQWAQQLLLLRRASQAGVAPPIVHVDENEHAIVSRRIVGAPLGAVLTDPATRGAVLGSVIAQLRALHALDATNVTAREPLPIARAEYAAQRGRPGFPAWIPPLDPAFDAVEKTLARDARRVVSHNDPNPGNVLWDGARAWLVDWEVAGLSHPYYDLAALSVFLRLDDDAAHGLLATQEQQPIDETGRATFAALRRIAALLCGLVFIRLVPDLSVLPETPPTLAEFYGALRTGTLSLQDPRGRGAFAMALLQRGLDRD